MNPDTFHLVGNVVICLTWLPHGKHFVTFTKMHCILNVVCTSWWRDVWLLPSKRWWSFSLCHTYSADALDESDLFLFSFEDINIPKTLMVNLYIEMSFHVSIWILPSTLALEWGVTQRLLKDAVLIYWVEHILANSTRKHFELGTCKVSCHEGPSLVSPVSLSLRGMFIRVLNTFLATQISTNVLTKEVTPMSQSPWQNTETIVII